MPNARRRNTSAAAPQHREPAAHREATAWLGLFALAVACAEDPATDNVRHSSAPSPTGYSEGGSDGVGPATNGGGSSSSDAGSGGSPPQAGDRSGNASGRESAGSETNPDAATDVHEDAGDPKGPDASSPTRTPVIPNFDGQCPSLADGDVDLGGFHAKLWVGATIAALRPLLLYWHATGSTSNEPASMLSATFDSILDAGGIIASFDGSRGEGENTGSGVWYTGDFETADALVACAIEQLNVDPRRIYVTGCSAGGLQAGLMLSYRSNYIAGAMLNSGGAVPDMSAFENPNWTPSLIAAYGTPSPMVVIDFPGLSQDLTQLVADRGGMAMNCHHPGGMCQSPEELIAAQWEYLKARPFGTQRDPDEGRVPAGFPDYCQVVTPRP